MEMCCAWREASGSGGRREGASLGTILNRFCLTRAAAVPVVWLRVRLLYSRMLENMFGREFRHHHPASLTVPTCF